MISQTGGKDTERQVMNMRIKTAWEIAEAWYTEEAIYNSINRVPTDVTSREFARWLTHQYRLAMAKGIQLGRSGSEDS